MRIAVGGLWHESNAFSPFETDLSDFQQYQFAVGEEVIEQYAGTGTEIGGAISAAGELRIEIVPLAFAAAVPSGPVTEGALRSVVGSVVERIRSTARVDGIVMALHGAMMAKGEANPEGHLLTEIRKISGSTPIAVTLDLHANLNGELCRLADVVVGYDSFPHVDMVERGAEAMRLMARMIRENSRPQWAHVKVPLVTAPQSQDTSGVPMRAIIDELHRVEALTGVWTASVVPGYPYSDNERLGCSVYVAGANCSMHAASLGARVWQVRRDFLPKLIEPEEAIALLGGRDGPIAVVDAADNVGGGSPGDGTVLLELLEERGRNDGVMVIWAPECIQDVYSRPASETETVLVRPADSNLGPAVRLAAPIKRLGRIQYKRSGPYMTGQVVDMGRVAIVSGRMGQVVLTENRVMPFDMDHLVSLGLDPRTFKVIVAKSGTAWKGAFPFVRSAIYVRTPGYCPSDLRQLNYSSRPRPLYPLEPEMEWHPHARQGGLGSKLR